MKKTLPLGIQGFRTLRLNNHIYVDKTEYIGELFKTASYFFLSRPRRFGKSLFLSTLLELFSGNRDLFEDTWIANSDYQWQKHPIIHLDFSKFEYNSLEEFKSGLMWELDEIASFYQIDLTKVPLIGLKIGKLVKELSKQAPVVILIDEYDAPILKHIDNFEMAKKMRDLLSDFYSAIKSVSSHCRFIFITGVSKFSQTSVFSGFNNLYDLSRPDEEKFGAILGYTEKELHDYFSDHIKDFASVHKYNDAEIFQKLKRWYNGYQFAFPSPKVYNPYSILYCLQKRIFANYWFETGTPSFLIKLIQQQERPVEQLNQLQITLSDFAAFDISNLPLNTLLFQTGYLTLSSYDSSMNLYQLSYPNYEVEESFNSSLIHAFSKLNSGIVSPYIFNSRKALLENRPEDFIKLLYNFYAQIPYDVHMNFEKYYQMIFYCLCKLLGLEIDAEVTTNIGRIDIVLTTSTHYYIIELKKEGSGQEALAQIHENKYYQKYELSGKKITLLGIAFDPQARNIASDWKIELYLT